MYKMSQEKLLKLLSSKKRSFYFKSEMSQGEIQEILSSHNIKATVEGDAFSCGCLLPICLPVCSSKTYDDYYLLGRQVSYYTIKREIDWEDVTIDHINAETEEEKRVSRLINKDKNALQQKIEDLVRNHSGKKGYFIYRPNIMSDNDIERYISGLGLEVATGTVSRPFNDWDDTCTCCCCCANCFILPNREKTMMSSPCSCWFKEYSVKVDWSKKINKEKQKLGPSTQLII